MKKSPRQGRFSQRVRWPSASAALFVWPKNSVIQICRADHLRFALFIYAKHTIKIEKSQSRPRATSLQTSLWIAFTQATLPRRDHGPLPPRKLGTFPTRGRQRAPASPQNQPSPTNKKSLPRTRGRWQPKADGRGLFRFVAPALSGTPEKPRPGPLDAGRTRPWL